MKIRYILDFPLQAVNEPVVYVLVKRFDLIVNILKAQIFPDRGGELLVEFEGPGEHIDAGLDYLRDLSVGVTPVEKRILHSAEKCVSCGECTSLCPGRALTIGEPTWDLVFDPTRCVACAMCVRTCPTRAFSTLW